MTTPQLKAGAVMTYGQGVANIDGTVTMNLTCADPGEGSGLSGAFTVTLTVANVATIQSAATPALKKTATDTIVTAILTAQYRLPAAVLAIQSQLDALVGKTVTIA